MSLDWSDPRRTSDAENYKWSSRDSSNQNQINRAIEKESRSKFNQVNRTPMTGTSPCATSTNIVQGGKFFNIAETTINFPLTFPRTNLKFPSIFPLYYWWTSSTTSSFVAFIFATPLFRFAVNADWFRRRCIPIFFHWFNTEIPVLQMKHMLIWKPIVPIYWSELNGFNRPSSPSCGHGDPISGDNWIDINSITLGT